MAVNIMLSVPESYGGGFLRRACNLIFWKFGPGWGLQLGLDLPGVVQPQPTGELQPRL